MKTQIKTLLLATDFTDKSENALRVAAKMAQRHDAQLIVTHSVHAYYIVDRAGRQVIGSDTLQESVVLATQKLDNLSIMLQKEYNLKVETKLSTQNVVDSINDLLVSEDIDLVILGTSGKQTVKELILGSHAYNVLLHAKCSVLLIPENFSKLDFKKILFPVRIPQELEQKADLSLLIADKNDGEINLLGVANVGSAEMVREAYMEMKKHLLLKYGEHFCEFKVATNNADVIADAALEQQSDLILLADHDEDSWKSFMAANFFKKIINKTDVPLLIVKPKIDPTENSRESMTNYDITMPIPG